MFDVGFWELMILGLVALLVIGPERLPRVAYTAGKWLGKGRSMINTVKREIDKEIKAEELKEILEKQKQQLNPLEEVIEETTGAVRELARETNEAVKPTETATAPKDDAADSSGTSGASGKTP